MVTILRHNIKEYLKFRDSISFRVFLICIAAAAVLAFFIVSHQTSELREAISKEKHEALISVAEEYSKQLSQSGLSSEVRTVPDGVPSRRIAVIDNNLTVLNDSFDIDDMTGKNLVLPIAVKALSGEAAFEFSDGRYVAAVPVTIDRAISGAVCVFETDDGLEHVFSAAVSSSRLSAVVVIVISVFAAFFISLLIISRTSALVALIKKTREKVGSDKIPLRHSDELSPVIREFNDIYEYFDYAQEMRRAFVSDASHELRTPLTATKLLCDSITQTTDMDTETMREFIGDIVLEVDRMSHTAEKLLVLSRLDNNSAVKLSPIHISEIVHNMITAFEPIASSKNVTIESYIEEDCSVLGETEGINQIVGNLIDNAIKYNNENGTLRIYLFTKGNKCVFITDDTGIGIAPEYRERVFERFYRIDKSRKHDGRGGSGLGLAIVKRNIESFGGTIKITDSVYGGSRFIVTLPSLKYGDGEEQ